MSYDVGTCWKATSLNKSHDKPQGCINPYMTEPYNQNHICNIVAFKSLTFNTMKRSVKICIFPCTDPNGVNNAVVPPPNLAIFPRDDLPPHSELQTYYSRYIVYSSGNWLAGWGSWGIDIFTLQIIDNTLTPTDHPITLQRECPNIPRTLAA